MLRVTKMYMAVLFGTLIWSETSYDVWCRVNVPSDTDDAIKVSLAKLEEDDPASASLIRQMVSDKWNASTSTVINVAADPVQPTERNFESERRFTESDRYENRRQQIAEEEAASKALIDEFLKYPALLEEQFALERQIEIAAEEAASLAYIEEFHRGNISGEAQGEIDRIGTDEAILSATGGFRNDFESLALIRRMHLNGEIEIANELVHSNGGSSSSIDEFNTQNSGGHRNTRAENSIRTDNNVRYNSERRGYSDGNHVAGGYGRGQQYAGGQPVTGQWHLWPNYGQYTGITAETGGTLFGSGQQYVSGGRIMIGANGKRPLGSQFDVGVPPPRMNASPDQRQEDWMEPYVWRHEPEIYREVGKPTLIITKLESNAQEKMINQLLEQIFKSNNDTHVYLMSDITLTPFLVTDTSRKFDPTECYIVIAREQKMWSIIYMFGDKSETDTHPETGEYVVGIYDRFRDNNETRVFRSVEIFEPNMMVRKFRDVYLKTKKTFEMYLIEKAGSSVSAHRVPLNPKLLKDDACIVLVTLRPSLAVKKFCGRSVNTAVKKMTKKITRIASLGNKDIVKTLKSGQRGLIQALNGDISNEEADKRKEFPILLVFREKQIEGSATSTPMNYKNLDNTVCYVMDSKSYAGLFVWIGNRSKIYAQIKAMNWMETYITENAMAASKHVSIIEEGEETVGFVISFPNWYL